MNDFILYSAIKFFVCDCEVQECYCEDTHEYSGNIKVRAKMFALYVCSKFA